MYLRVIGKDEWLAKVVSIPLLVGYLVSQSDNNFLVRALDLSISLEVICCRWQMFDAYVSADSC